MGRQSGDSSTMVGSSSSIALLQERFRQLQRVREKREEKEERELLNLFSETNERRINNSTMSFESSKLSFQPEEILPLRPPPLHDALALGLNLQSSRDTSFKGNNTTKPFTNLWPSDSAAIDVRTSKNNFDSSDVDTSLHL